LIKHHVKETFAEKEV